jgi:DNA-binding transcriptional MerR regulator
MTQADPTFTLAEIARRLQVPQHRLIHLCEKQVVTPDVKDAGGRGSSRVFSERNFLELTVALRLRDMMLPVAATGAIIHVIRALEDKLGDEIPGFSLVGSLPGATAPDLRVIISDGHLIFFTLGLADARARLFGGVSIEDIEGNAALQVGPLEAIEAPAPDAGFGGPEGSSFSRSEISLTAVARSLPLG